MNRRSFLQAAALLTAGVSAVPKGWTLDAEQSKFLAAQPDYINRHKLDFFSDTDRRAVTAMAEQIIPATDTPGAIDAGVPRFIELMVADWFNEGERETFVTGLASFQQRASGDFAALSVEEQLLLLEAAEAEVADDDWYAMGNVMRVWDESAPFICQFKELSVLGFCLSKEGATQFLRKNPMGTFQGDIPLKSTDAAYSTLTPIRTLFGRISNED